MRRTAKGHPQHVRAACIARALLVGLAMVLGLNLERLTRKSPAISDGNPSGSGTDEALPVTAAETVPHRVVEGQFEPGMTLAKLLEALSLPPAKRASLPDAANSQGPWQLLASCRPLLR